MKTIAAEVKIGDLLKSPFLSKTFIRVEEIISTEQYLTFIGPYVENPDRELIGHICDYTLRKTTKVNIKPA